MGKAFALPYLQRREGLAWREEAEAEQGPPVGTCPELPGLKGSSAGVAGGYSDLGSRALIQLRVRGCSGERHQAVCGGAQGVQAILVLPCALSCPGRGGQESWPPRGPQAILTTAPNPGYTSGRGGIWLSPGEEREELRARA